MICQNVRIFLDANKLVSSFGFLCRTCDLYQVNEPLYGRVKKKIHKMLRCNYITCVPNAERNLSFVLLTEKENLRQKAKAIAQNENHKVLAYLFSVGAYLLYDLNLFLTFCIRYQKLFHLCVGRKTLAGIKSTEASVARVLRAMSSEHSIL